MKKSQNIETKSTFTPIIFLVYSNKLTPLSRFQNFPLPHHFNKESFNLLKKFYLTASFKYIYIFFLIEIVLTFILNIDLF